MAYTYFDPNNAQNHITINNDALFVDYYESYKQTGPMASGGSDGLNYQNRPFVEQIDGMEIYSPTTSGRYALIIGEPESSSHHYAMVETSGLNFIINVTADAGEPDESTYTDHIGQFPSALYDGIRANSSLESNVPIFKPEDVSYYNEYISAVITDARAREIIRDYAVNYKEKSNYDVDETKRHHIYNEYATGTQTQGNVEESGNRTKHYLEFRSNTPPVGYYDENYNVKFILNDIVDWAYSTASWQSLVEMPTSEFHEGELPFNGPWYGNISSLTSCGGVLPADGSYNYGFLFDTDAFIYPDRQSALDAIATGDYSKAGNYYSVNNGQTFNPPKLGTEELATIFGDGMAVSPFVSAYIMSRAQLINVADIFFTNDSTLFDNIKKGLELYGADPMNDIVGINYFPFDVTSICSTSPQSYIYFGSYKHDLNSPVNKIINMNANYLNGGSGYVAPLFNNYRDFEPFTSLHIWIPFVGFKKLDIAEYINKTLSVRYYIDIYTRQCAVVLLANGIMVDGPFTGEIGQTLPVVGTSYSQYAIGQIEHLNKSFLTGSALQSGLMNRGIEMFSSGLNLSGAMQNGGIYPGFSEGVQYKIGQYGSPKDHQKIQGSFTPGVGNYMPNYVFLRWETSEIFEPYLLNQLYGKPSTASGTISQFSGFISGRVSSINTDGMESEEIKEINESILNDGIYL